MSIFTEAYKVGIDAGQKALSNIEEINSVFEELNAEISASSEGKISITREVITKTRRVRRLVKVFEKALGLNAPVPYYDEEFSYNAIIAKNAKKQQEIAEYDMSEAGYPIRIKWSDRDENCWDKTALTETLEEVLSDASTGKIILQLLSEKTANVE